MKQLICHSLNSDSVISCSKFVSLTQDSQSAGRPTHLRHYRQWSPQWWPDSSQQPAWYLTNILAHTHSLGHFMAYGTSKQPKTLDINTKYSATTELQWRPLSPWRGCWQHISLSRCLFHFPTCICLCLPVFSVPLDIIYVSTFLYPSFICLSLF